MGVIFKREFKAYLSNIIGWVFIAVSIGAAGAALISVNFVKAYPQIESGFLAAVLTMLLSIPFLCMFSFSPENKNGNIKFLLSLPIKTQNIVIGKYLAALAVFAIPTAIMATFPLILSVYGTVLFAPSYATIFAYFLVGASMIAICMFIGSRTQRSILSLILGILVSAVLYAGPTMSWYLPTLPVVSLVSILALELVIAFIVWLTSKQLPFASVIFALLALPTAIAFIVSSSSFAALFQRILLFLSPFERLSNFTQGIFRLGDVLYFLSIIIFFLFLTYRGVEKNRDGGISLKNKKPLLTVIASVVLLVALNLGVCAIPAGVISFDTSGLGMYSISDVSKDFAAKIDEDITIYLICENGVRDVQTEKVLMEYEKASSHIDYKPINVTADPDFLIKYKGLPYDKTDENGNHPIKNNSIIIESGRRHTIIDPSDFYHYRIGIYDYTEIEFLYWCQQAMAEGYDINAIGYQTFFDMDKIIVLGIEYVTLDIVNTVFTLKGHGEGDLADAFYESLKYSNVVYDDLVLEQHDSIPNHCSALIIASPATDLSSEDADKIIEYLNRGGDVILITSPENTKMKNLLRVAECFGLTAEQGIISDKDPSYHTNNDHTDLILQPNTSHSIISFLKSNYDLTDETMYPRFPNAHAIVKINANTNDLIDSKIFQTSNKAVLSVNGEITGSPKEYIAGYGVEKVVGDNKANLLWYSSYDAFTQEVVDSRSANMLYLLVAVSYVGGADTHKTTLPVESCNISGAPLKVPRNIPVVWGIMFGLITLIMLAASVAIFITRRSRKNIL